MSFNRKHLAALAVMTAASISTAASATEPKGGPSGLFIGCFQTEAMPGATALTMNLAFNAPSHGVSGLAHVSQAVNPPLYVPSRVSGSYSVMTVMPNTTHIQVRVTGYPTEFGPGEGGTKPLTMPNLDAIMVLDKGWQAGTVQYAYTNSIGQPMGKPIDQKIKQVACGGAK